MKKVIYCASTFSHIKNFHMPYIKQLVEDNNEVIIVAGGEVVELPYVNKCIKLPIHKKILSPNNIVAAAKLRRIVSAEQPDLIYVHTTLAACIVRIALLGYKSRPYLINMVHGYLFSKDSRVIKNKIYLGIEKILKRYTDSIVVMNEEDLSIASENKLAIEDIYLVKGVGVDKQKFLEQPIEGLTRAKLNIKNNDKIIIFVGELSKRKNQGKLIDVMSYLPDSYHLILVGDGSLQNEYQQMLDRHTAVKRIHMVGYQSNTREYYRLSDICVSLSLGEGLPFNVVEAMLCKLPVIASDIKGHRELIDPNWLIDSSDSQAIARFIMSKTSDELKQEGEHNFNIAEQYTLENVFDDNYNFLKGKL